jgi:3-hydroxyisobutyrate dehydrogenase
LTSGATKGTLAALIGGDTKAYELVRPIISCFSDKQTHLGVAGSGHLVKAINNVRINTTVQ